jgi:hypothetical protein
MNQKSAFAIAAASLIVVSPISAQTRGLNGPSTTPVPRDLVEALLAQYSFGGGGGPTITIDSFPAAISSRVFLPPNARILGGMLGGMSGGATGIIVVPARPDSVAAQLQRELPRFGWKWADRNLNQFVGMVGGFADAPTSTGPAAPNPNEPLTYCAATTSLTVKIDYLGVGQTRVFFTTGRNGLCTTTQAQRGIMDPYSGFRPRAPLLYNPTNARLQQTPCTPEGSYNFGGGSNNAQIWSTASVDELFSHYGKQLADSGWKQEPDQIIGRAWTRADTAGNVTRYQLSISTFPAAPSCRKLTTSVEGRVNR